MTSGLPYAEVIGDPIAHSKSPLIHNFWLGKLGIEAEYRASRVERGGLTHYLAERKNDPDWRGCNVTMPHKMAALACTDLASTEASAVGAANILRRRGGLLVAENSDVRAIRRLLAPFLPSLLPELCLIGAGGAARAALAALKDDFRIAMIQCRNAQEGRGLLDEFGYGGALGAIGQASQIKTADLIINASPLGMAGNMPMPVAVLDALQDPLSEDTVVFDMVTAPAETDLLRSARFLGLRTISGLEMLVEQAAISFEQFFGRSAPRDNDAELMASLTA